jgi:cytochrome c
MTLRRASDGSGERESAVSCISRTAAVALAFIIPGAAAALAGGNPTIGQTVFAAQCAVCHSIKPGENKTGPSLAGIVGSKSGTVPGFAFSPAMKNAGVTWNDFNLDAFLANPTGFIHGTMMFVGLANGGDRANVIAYLDAPKK